MNQQQFLTALERALGQDAGTLQLSQAFEDLDDWDSMAVLEFQAIADEEFGMQVDPTALGTVKTVEELWNEVAKQAGA